VLYHNQLKFPECASVYPACGKEATHFKIQQCDSQYTFVTQQFMDIITQNNLTGGKFTRVYPPMTDELRQQAYGKAMKKRKGRKKIE